MGTRGDGYDEARATLTTELIASACFDTGSDPPASDWRLAARRCGEASHHERRGGAASAVSGGSGGNGGNGGDGGGADGNFGDETAVAGLHRPMRAVR